MADRKVFLKTALTGGGADALDNIDGADRGDGNPLADKDAALVFDGTNFSAYIGDIDSGLAESSPNIIKPDTNAGDFRWILQGVSAGFDIADYLAIANIDDTPVDGVVNAPISSNWAYDHAASTTAHGNSGTNTGDEPDASTTVAGVVELAIASEVNTGTSDTLAVTPDALAGSYAGKKAVEILVFDYATDLVAGDGKAYFIVPDELNGMNLVRVAATVFTAGTTNSTVIDIYNVTDSCDVLSTGMNIETGELSTRTSAMPGTIDATHDDVATGDKLRIDLTSISSTAPKGLLVEMVFQLP